MIRPEIANLTTFLVKGPFKYKPFFHFLNKYEDLFFSLVVVLVVCPVVIFAVRKRATPPGPFQNAIEYFVEVSRKFVCEILGKEFGDRYLPFLGSLFLFIFFSNILGLFPLFRSPTASFKTTASLAILTFLYVQFVGFRQNGFMKYFHYLAGSPKDVVGWFLSPLMLVLHFIGELAKPLSLSLRLFGNIFGEDLLLGAFVGMGVVLVAATGLVLPAGVPFQLPFLFLALLTSFIQALVFSLLATIYFLLVLPQSHH